MAKIPKVHRINPEDLKRGTIVERSEHPKLKASEARQVARDHLEMDSSYYSENGGSGRSVVILNQNVKAVAQRKKKQPPKQKQGFNVLTWGNELIGL